MNRKNTKKGIVIEIVLIAIVITFALCTIMAAYGIKSIGMSKYASSEIEERINIDQIVNDYFNYINGNDKFDKNSYKYLVNKEEYTYLIWPDITNTTIMIEGKEGFFVHARYVYNEITEKYDIETSSGQLEDLNKVNSNLSAFQQYLNGDLSKYDEIFIRPDDTITDIFIGEYDLSIRIEDFTGVVLTAGFTKDIDNKYHVSKWVYGE